MITISCRLVFLDPTYTYAYLLMAKSATILLLSDHYSISKKLFIATYKKTYQFMMVSIIKIKLQTNKRHPMFIYKDTRTYNKCFILKENIICKLFC